MGAGVDPTHERRLLRIYLGDHLAMMRAGASLASRMRAGPLGHEVGALLDEVGAELEDARGTVVAYLAQLGASPPRLKLAGAVVAERLGRLKLNGRVAERSPLSDLLELEGLRAVMGGAAGLWRALERAGVAAADQVSAHAERAERLGERLEAARLATAARVLGAERAS